MMWMPKRDRNNNNDKNEIILEKHVAEKDFSDMQQVLRMDKQDTTKGQTRP